MTQKLRRTKEHIQRATELNQVKSAITKAIPDGTPIDIVIQALLEEALYYQIKYQEL